MTDVEHRPVYGSKESDEFICSCDWRGPAFEVAEHYENIASDARAKLERFGMLVENECGDDDWQTLDKLETSADFLSPVQFVIALRNQGFKRKES
jgi:hypothetical protein